jgi:hypothetical protein
MRPTSRISKPQGTNLLSGTASRGGATDSPLNCEREKKNLVSPKLFEA